MTDPLPEPDPAEPPPPAPLVVTAEVVGRRLGVAELSDDQRTRVTDAILDAQADAQAVVNRELFASPVRHTEVRPDIFRGPSLDLASWPSIHAAYDDLVTIVAYLEQPVGSGQYRVDVLVGLDGPNSPILVRFVTAHAVETLRHEPGSGFGKREVSSVSADGQSVSYTGRGAGSGQGGGMAVGSLPSTKMLEPLRRRGVFKRNRAERSPWPYSDFSYRPR